METSQGHGAVQEFHLPEWETSARRRGEKHIPMAAGEGFKDRARGYFNRVMPVHRKYCGLSRKVACIIVLAASVAIVVLIVGLAAGLSHRSNNHQSLPLGSQTYSGDLTYYGPGLGACGVTASDSDHIVSISHFDVDAASIGSDPNANPLCGHKLRAVRNGKSVDLSVVDRCVGCKPTDIDVSPGAFKQLADPALGRVKVTWAWLPPIPST